MFECRDLILKYSRAARKMSVQSSVKPSPRAEAPKPFLTLDSFPAAFRLVSSHLNSFASSVIVCTHTHHINTNMSTYNSSSIRTATVTRKTAETDISCTLTLDHAPGTKQVIEVSTGIGFLDHVRHSRQSPPPPPFAEHLTESFACLYLYSRRCCTRWRNTASCHYN